MNPREKTMIMVLGALLAAGVAWTAKTQYVSTLNSLKADYGKACDALSKVETEQRQLMRGKSDWMDAGRETLAITDGEAQTLFRPDIDALVQEVGLTNSTVQIKGTTKTGTSDLRNLNCTVTADGRLNDLLRFFLKLHQRPYVVRCQLIRVQRPNDTKLPKEILRLTADIDTLILPDARKYDLPRIKPVNLTSQPTRPPQRLSNDSLDYYSEIVRKKIFERWEPPIPPPDKVAGHRPGNGQTHVFNLALAWNGTARATSYDVYFGEKPDAIRKVMTVAATSYTPSPPLKENTTYYWRVDATSAQGTTKGDLVSFTAVPAPKVEPVKQVIVEQPPADQNLVFARIVSSPRGQQVVLEDPANKTAEDKRVEVGETLYGGTLVMVHPKGAVSEKDGKLRFHPPTKALRDCVPLTEDTQPQLLDLVRQLEKRGEGISHQPG